MYYPEITNLLSQDNKLISGGKNWYLEITNCYLEITN